MIWYSVKYTKDYLKLEKRVRIIKIIFFKIILEIEQRNLIVQFKTNFRDDEKVFLSLLIDERNVLQLNG
jgi:hypothetical protein